MDKKFLMKLNFVVCCLYDKINCFLFLWFNKRTVTTQIEYIQIKQYVISVYNIIIAFRFI